MLCTAQKCYKFVLQDSPDDRPAAVIHRNFDDVYNNNNAPALGNPLALMQNFNIPLTSLPELVPEASMDNKTKSETKRELPVFPGQPLPLTTEINVSFYYLEFHITKLCLLCMFFL